MAIDASAVARVLGIETTFKDLRAGGVLFLPQRIAVLAQGNSDSDNGMRARCRNCGGRGVVEAPRVVTHSPDYADGIREGERRMLWLVAIGAEWNRVRYSAYWDQTCCGALRALALRGDEDASRVLGERGW